LVQKTVTARECTIGAAFYDPQNIRDKYFAGGNSERTEFLVIPKGRLLP
jgi:hypothetical protein